MAIDTSIRIRLIDGFSAGMRTMAASAGALSRSLAGTGPSFDAMNRAARQAGDWNQAAEGIGRFGDMARTAITVPTQAFIGFESAMSRVSALSGEVGTEGFASMRAQAQELGAATSFSASEAALAMGNFAQAGMRANQILSLTPPTMALARAAAAGLDQTSEILGSTLNSMGIDAAQAGMAADILTRTFTSSNTTLASLGDTFRVAAPLARQTGTDLQTLAAMTAVLGNSAIQGSEAGTGLRTVMASLQNPVGEGARAMHALGLRGQELVRIQEMVASGRMPEALAAIGGRLNGLTNDKKLAALMRIFGREGVTSASILIDAAMDTSDRGLAGYARALRNADGAAASVAATMEDNLGGEMERLSGAVDGLYISLGQRFAPGLRQLATDLQGTVGSVDAFTASHPALASGLGTALTGTVAFTVGVRALALTASAATTTIGLTKTGLAGLRVGLAALVGPAGLIVAALGGMAYWANSLVEAERESQRLQRARGQEQQREGLERHHEMQRREIRQQRERDGLRRLELESTPERERTKEQRRELTEITQRTAMFDRRAETQDDRRAAERRMLEINQGGTENTPEGRRERTELTTRMRQIDDYVNGITDSPTAERAGFGLARIGAGPFDGRRGALPQDARPSDIQTQDGINAEIERRRAGARQGLAERGIVGGSAPRDAEKAAVTAANTAAAARLTSAIEAMTRALQSSGGRDPLGGGA